MLPYSLRAVRSHFKIKQNYNLLKYIYHSTYIPVGVLPYLSIN